MLNRIFLCLLFLLFCKIALPQTNNSAGLPVSDYSSPKEYTIENVKVTGVKYLDTMVLKSMSGLTAGRKIKVPGDELTKIIDKFWTQGLFSDVKVFASKIEGDKIWIEIKLTEQPRVTKFTLTGVRKGQITDLNEKLNVKPGNQVTTNLLNNIKTIILKFYREKGYWSTKVNITQVKDTVMPNRVYLNTEIVRGSKVKIASVDFDGNEHFTDKRLRRVLKKTKQRSINFFRSSKFVESNYKEDKNKLVEFFEKNGYRDYLLLSDSITVLSENRIAIHLNIHEGNQYHIRSIRWIGNTKYPDEILDRVLLMKKGDVYDLDALNKRLERDDEAVHNLYLNNGYLFSRIEPVEAKIQNDSVDLEMQVTEGRQATIKNIIISGNTKTNEHVVRRELDTYPGRLFSKADIVNSVRRLGQLGHFNPEKIEPVPLPNESDGTVDIRYNLEEKANDQLELSGGYGGYGVVGTLGLKFNNFSARNILKPKAWRPVPSGDGQALSLRVQTTGQQYKAYSMSFTEPWFGGKKPNSFTFSAYRSVQTGNSYIFVDTSNQYFKVNGISVGLGKRLKWPDDNFNLYNELSFQNYSLHNWNNSAFIISNGTSNNISFKIALSRNTSGNPIYPRDGSSFMISLQVTPPYSAFESNNFWELSSSEKAELSASDIQKKENENRYRWIEYHKWSYKGTWYNQLAKDLVLSFNSQFGYLGYYSRNLGYSPFEGFSLGGSGFTGYNVYGTEVIALRGYEDGTVTPRVSVNGRTIDVANIYSKVTMELRYPLTLQPSATIYGLAFLESGNSWYKFEDFNPFGMKRSAGVGVRAFLPMFGMLGIDWGYGFDDVPGNSSHSHFHFVMGQQF